MHIHRCSSSLIQSTQRVVSTVARQQIITLTCCPTSILCRIHGIYLEMVMTTHSTMSFTTLVILRPLTHLVCSVLAKVLFVPPLHVEGGSMSAKFLGSPQRPPQVCKYPIWIEPQDSSSGSFQYSGSTVRISVEEGTEHPRLLKEWGEPIGPDDDIYDLDHLSEFESTDFASLWPMSSPLDDSNPTFANIERPPLKRRKLDFHPLHNFIPQVRSFAYLTCPTNVAMQPHVHPSSRGSSSIPLDVPRYRPKTLFAIPPYTLPFSPSSQFFRTTWLIPIRGSLPWEASTSAVILDASFSMPVSPNPHTGEPIVWTHASLASFWSYLLHLQDSRRVGTIGVSFQASDSVMPFLSSSSQSNTRPNTFPSTSGMGNQTSLESHLTSDGGSVIISSPASNVALSNVDHIKIYHEAPNAMHVRAALFSWSYPYPPLPSLDTRTIRVLRGAKLLLIDERSRGILIA